MEKSNSNQTFTRRDVLKTSLAGAALAVPYFVSSRVLGAQSPSNRVTLGCIGVGNQGLPVMQRFLNNTECQVLAVCEVNQGSKGYKEPDKLYGRKPAREEVEAHYAKKSESGSFKGCEDYGDFRDVLARKDIDAVVIAAPDHWHSIMTVMAAEAGKDVYCEKPLGLTIGDQQAMVKAVREHNRILQTGSHERSNPNVKKLVELVQSGGIGKVKRVICNVGRHNMIGPGPDWKPTAVPEWLDYKMWLGPAPDAPYHDDRCLYRFRFNYDYAGGQVTNFGAHSLDIAQWGLGRDKSGPVKVEHVYSDFLPTGSLFNAATYTHFRCTYDDGVVLECMTGSPDVRCEFEGTEGSVRIDNQGRQFVTIPERLKTDRFGKDLPEVYPSNDDHQRNFIECVKTRQEPAAPVEVGHRSGTVCHLGNIAVRLKTSFKWDPEKEQITDNEKANAMLHRDVKQTWTA
jgi:predicted dehydrogenase